MRRIRLRNPLAITLVVLAALPVGSTVTMAEPAAIEAKRAEVAEIESQLAEIDAQVGVAAEAYNGARYRLGIVRDRIAANKRTLKVNAETLAVAQDRLEERLADLYRQPDPSLVEVLVTADSLTEAVDTVEALDRASTSDDRAVQNVRESRERLEQARRELKADEAETEKEVAAAERERERVQALLAERQAVLDQAEGELGQLIREEQERQRREAEARAAAARAAAAQQAAERQAAASASATVTPAAPSTSAPSAPIPSGSGNAAAAQIALQYQGVPYVWGGASPSGFDCSGLASYAYAQIGKSVPHYTGAIWAAFPRVPDDQLQPGDLVFFRADLGHMGIYIGGGNMVHAPHTGDVVRITSLAGRTDYVGAVRP